MWKCRNVVRTEKGKGTELMELLVTALFTSIAMRRFKCSNKSIYRQNSSSLRQFAGGFGSFVFFEVISCLFLACFFRGCQLSLWAASYLLITSVKVAKYLFQIIRCLLLSNHCFHCFLDDKQSITNVTTCWRRVEQVKLKKLPFSR